MSPFNSWRDQFQGHICGCYVILPSSNEKLYLSQVKLDVQTRITPVHSTTKLTQVFYNPRHSQASPEVRYCFPLYDGVTVCGYAIKFADKHLVGIVKQKDDAKATYQAAVDSGQAAGLLESLPAGVFGVTLGNVPTQTEITVEISYTSELKHDAGIDGLRYTLPTRIAPRYGKYPSKIIESNATPKGGIKITVDVDMELSHIRKIESPSHPISVTLGSTSADAKSTDFASSKASATLALGSAELDEDFVLQVLVDDINRPQALIETHTTIAHQRAILATLVPKFKLPSADPEIVFIADQSGSMAGVKNQALVNSLKVFIKSLPFNVRFNLCAFGSRFNYLWPKSQPYNEENVQKALQFVNSFTASHGGTEILPPIVAAFEQRLSDMPLEVMLLTDGEVWGEASIFEFINSKVHGTATEASTNARVFSLGIGADVSHTLVEGVARAGNGFSQFVVDGENVDKKIIRMLKGALYAHTSDYSVEVNFGEAEAMSNHNDDEEFELVEKVETILTINEENKDKSAATTGGVKTQSFFDETADDSDNHDNKDKKERYGHLPEIQRPGIFSAPSEIPPLYPFNRTTLYLLLGPEASQKSVKSITIRAKANDVPLELTVPVRDVGTGTAIHQLAARKAIQELEDGRGWLHKAKTSVGNEHLRDKYPSRIDEFTEREAVRLGEQFQVVSRWTSFVAVQKGASSDDAVPSVFEQQATATQFGRGGPPPPATRLGMGSVRQRVSHFAVAPQALHAPLPAPAPMSAPLASAAYVPAPTGAFFGQSSSLMSTARRSRPAPTAPATKKKRASPGLGFSGGVDEDFIQEPSSDMSGGSQSSNKLRAVIDAQTFSGLWQQSSDLLGLLGVSNTDLSQFKDSCAVSLQAATKTDVSQVYVTVLAIAWLRKKHGDDEEIWDMVVEKAIGVLQKDYGLLPEQIEEMIRNAGTCFSS